MATPRKCLGSPASNERRRKSVSRKLSIWEQLGMRRVEFTARHHIGCGFTLPVCKENVLLKSINSLFPCTQRVRYEYVKYKKMGYNAFEKGWQERFMIEAEYNGLLSFKKIKNLTHKCRPLKCFALKFSVHDDILAFVPGTWISGYIDAFFQARVSGHWLHKESVSRALWLYWFLEYVKIHVSTSNFGVVDIRLPTSNRYDREKAYTAYFRSMTRSVRIRPHTDAANNWFFKQSVLKV